MVEVLVRRDIMMSLPMVEQLRGWMLSCILPCSMQMQGFLTTRKIKKTTSKALASFQFVPESVESKSFGNFQALANRMRPAVTKLPCLVRGDQRIGSWVPISVETTCVVMVHPLPTKSHCLLLFRALQRTAGALR